MSAYNKRANMRQMLSCDGRLNIQIFVCNKESNMVPRVNERLNIQIFTYNKWLNMILYGKL